MDRRERAHRSSDHGLDHVADRSLADGVGHGIDNGVDKRSERDAAEAVQHSTERSILFFSCAAHALTHVYMVMYSAVLEPMGADLGLSLKELTGFVAISATLFGVGALPLGWLSDRWGEKPLLVVFFLLTSAGGAVVGLSRGPLLLVVGMVCLGLGASIFHPVGNSMIARGIRRPGRAMGINGFWGSLGEAAGPIFAAQIAILVGWRWAYVGLALPMWALAWALALSPLRLKRPAHTDPVSGGRGLPAALVLLFAAMVFAGVQFWLVKTMLPTHVRVRTPDGLLPPVLRAGYLTGLIYAVGGLGQYIAGWLLERGGGLRLYCLVFLLLCPLVYAVGRLQGAALIVTASLMSVLLFSPQPIENAILARIAPPRWQGLVYGLKFVLTFGVGGMGTYLSGWIEGPFGTSGVFTAAAVSTATACLLAAGASIVDRRSGPENGSPRAAAEEATPAPGSPSVLA